MGKFYFAIIVINFEILLFTRMFRYLLKFKCMDFFSQASRQYMQLVIYALNDSEGNIYLKNHALKFLLRHGTDYRKFCQTKTLNSYTKEGCQKNTQLDFFHRKLEQEFTDFQR